MDDVFYYCHGNILFNPALIPELSLKYTLFKSNVLAVTKACDDLQHIKMLCKEDRIASFLNNNQDAEYSFLGLSIYIKKDILSFTGVKYFGMSEVFLNECLDSRKGVYCIINKFHWKHIETNDDYEKIADKNIAEIIK